MRHARGHRRALATAAGLALAALAACPSPASATGAHESGARAVNVLAASSTWVVYAIGTDVHARPTGGGARVSVPDADSVNTPSLAGGFVTYDTRRNIYKTHYRNLDTGASGTAGSRWSAASPDGGVFGAFDAADGAMHGYDQNAATGTVTDLGRLPGMHKGTYVNALADARGAAFMQQLDNGRNQVDYVAFGRPAHATALRTGGLGHGSCTSLVSNALGCAEYGGDHILRVPLDGSAPQRITVTYPRAPSGVTDYPVAFVTPTHTFWVFAFDADDSYHGPDLGAPLHSVPATSPHAPHASSSFVVTRVERVQAGGNVVYVAHPGHRAGIYTVRSAQQRPSPFLRAPS